MSDTRFHGIYPSTVLPMRADFSPDWEAYAKHTAHCVMRPGIRGVLINGHAGENYVITRAEKRLHWVVRNRLALPKSPLGVADLVVRPAPLTLEGLEPEESLS